MKRTRYVKTTMAMLAVATIGLVSLTLPGVAGAKSVRESGPCLQLTATTFSATAGVPVSPTVATFTDRQPPSFFAQFSATIQWGDGTITGGVVSQPGGHGTPYAVTGTHTYTTQGTYTTHITIFQVWPAFHTARAAGEATVGDYAIDATGVPIAAQATAQAFTVPVATFTDANPEAPLSEFTALIDWGDSSTSAGTITQPGGTGTTFDVAGGHTYTASGTYTVTITIRDTGGTKAVVTEPVAVSDSGSTLTCSSSGCSGTVSTPLQTDVITSKSTTGSIQASIDSSSLVCDGTYRHAPQVTTINGTGLNPNKPIEEHLTFPRSELVGPAGAPVEVCYQANPGSTFIDLDGQTVTQGLLPLCGSLTKKPPKLRLGPCVRLQRPISTLHGTISERLAVPPNDPRHS
ncbi:MAG TPA: hypothetical protein VHW93_04670 [Acidimicrobiales bacterium]|jgi:hypothetical protein|nr:hypothetical protein [Acidimicrobiales bacterium]